MNKDYKKLYLKYKAKYLKLKNEENTNGLVMTGGSIKNKSNENTLYLFKAEWCPHCVAFKPTWKALQEEFKNEINFVTYDSDQNSKEIKSFNIEGFPTLILQAGNKAIEYVGPRDAQSLKDFVKQYK